MKTNKKTKNKLSLKRFISVLGPGLVTGAADDDPSGIVTYSQSGAAYGLGQLWTTVFMLPLMIAIQEMCGRIGLVTGKGIAKNIKENYSKKVLYCTVGLLFIANTINLGADLGAMSAVLRLFVNIPFVLAAFLFFLLIIILQIFVPYHRYAKILKWLTITLLAYFVTGFLVAHNWGDLLRATFLPSIKFNSEYLFLLLGVIGTTISPYMFFWQASQEVEERDQLFTDKVFTQDDQNNYVANMRIDTFLGMVFSEVATWFIIITTALVLHANGVTQIQTAAQAAQALEPLVKVFPNSGLISEILFAVGIIGTGLLAIPIFAATSAYAVSEIFNWKESLENDFKDARSFYGVILLGSFLGLLMNWLNIDPIKALIYTAVINGIIAVPLIFMILKISNNKKIMGDDVNGFWSNFFGWITFFAFSLAALFILYNFWH